MDSFIEYLNKAIAVPRIKPPETMRTVRALDFGIEYMWTENLIKALPTFKLPPTLRPVSPVHMQQHVKPHLETSVDREHITKQKLNSGMRKPRKKPVVPKDQEEPSVKNMLS